MADKTVKFALDLDIKEFTEKGIQAKGIIDKIGEAEGLEGLIEGLAATSAVLGTVGLAVFSFKEALDLTVEAEAINRVTQQFDLLTAAAGISAKELKEGLDEQAKGLVDNTDLMKIANEQIIKMGASASKLPEVLELARKSTAVFGGDVKTNFENMSTAIANGNTRMLKQYGILVDAEKAVKDFAAANGLAANEVSEAGRRQAIMNAALEQGQKAFKGVDTNLNEATTTLQALKVTVGEVGELFTLAFEKKMGPSVRNFLSGVKEMATDARVYLTSMFGEGLEKNQALISETEKKLNSLKAEVIDLGQQGAGEGFFEKVFKGNKEDRITKINADIAATTAQLNKLKQENKSLETQEEQAAEKRRAAAGGGNEGDDIAKNEIKLQNQAKFQAQLWAIKKQYFDLEVQNITSLTQVDALEKQQQLFAEQEHLQKIREVKNSEHLNASQKKQLLKMEDDRYHQALQQNENKTSALRKTLLDNYTKNAKTAFQGIGNAFQAMALRNKAAISDFGKRGEEVTQSFQTHSVYAFETMGEEMVKGKNIAEAAADAMKGFFLNMLADRAIAEGSMLLLSGIWPPNPLALGAGAGLIALGGALRTLAGGSGATIAGASGGGPGVSGGYGVATEPKDAAQENSAAIADSGVAAEAAMPEMATQQRNQRSVTVSIAGNYFDTDTSRRQLMEMIRQETDATDFRYDRIGAS